MDAIRKRVARRIIGGGNVSTVVMMAPPPQQQQQQPLTPDAWNELYNELRHILRKSHPLRRDVQIARMWLERPEPWCLCDHVMKLYHECQTWIVRCKRCGCRPTEEDRTFSSHDDCRKHGGAGAVTSAQCSAVFDMCSGCYVTFRIDALDWLKRHLPSSTRIELRYRCGGGRSELDKLVI
jgi:hypothetical protein